MYTLWYFHEKLPVGLVHICSISFIIGRFTVKLFHGAVNKRNAQKYVIGIFIYMRPVQLMRRANVEIKFVTVKCDDTVTS